MTARPIDPTSYEYRPLAEYSRWLPSSRLGKRVHRSTLFRWATRGLPGGIRLQTAKIGSCRYTCDAWVADFIAEMTGSAGSPATRTASISAGDGERIKQRFKL